MFAETRCPGLQPVRLHRINNNLNQIPQRRISQASNANYHRQRTLVRRHFWGRFLEVFRSQMEQQPNQKAATLVDELIETCLPTDGGLKVLPATRQRISELFVELQRYRPRESMKSKHLWGTFKVIYATNPTDSGGPFRTPLGRLALPGQQLYNVVDKPNLVGNLIEFKALGFVDGFVGLRGTLEPSGSHTYKFELPERLFKLLGRVDITPFDFNSEFELLYIDERVRLARSIPKGREFVFLRAENKDYADFLFREIGSEKGTDDKKQAAGFGTKRLASKKSKDAEVPFSDLVQDEVSGTMSVFYGLGGRKQPTLATMAERQVLRRQKSRSEGQKVSEDSS